MFKRFLDYFGLELKLIERSNKEKLYKVVPPEIFDPFINDIDKCLARKAERIIADAQKTKAELIEKIANNSSNNADNSINTSINNEELTEQKQFDAEVKQLENSLPIIKLAEIYEQNGDIPENIKTELSDAEIMAILNLAKRNIFLSKF